MVIKQTYFNLNQHHTYPEKYNALTQTTHKNINIHTN